MPPKPIRYITGLFICYLAVFVIFGTIFLSASMSQSSLPSRILWLIFLSLIGTIITLSMIFFTAPYVADFIATFRRLTRLDSLNHPLLVKLSLEAPGTYHHSLMLSTLSHKAAKAIGADPLLCRVGAYYHDIGKLKDPSFYIENQPGDHNPHDSLLPNESAGIIKDHVNYGETLAKEHHLPEEIKAFIKEHQGTSMISYFYNKAKKMESEGKLKDIKIADFRYGGPKPQSKETAIILLADSIEAKVRSLPNVTEDTIKQLVKDTTDERLNDGQLSEAALSDKEIIKIKNAFIDALGSMYHKRIDYKKNEAKKTARKTADFGL